MCSACVAHSPRGPALALWRDSARPRPMPRMAASLPPNYLAAGLMVWGVFLGSALWWLFLSGSVGLLRSRITPQRLQGINRLSGCVLIGFGVYALGRSIVR